MLKSELWGCPQWRAQHWGKRRGGPWTEEEEAKALLMRLFKKSDDEIATALGRTKKSVAGKIGYWKKNPRTRKDKPKVTL